MAEDDGWRPGKGGLHADLTGETLNWFHQTLEAVWNAAGDEEQLNELIDSKKPTQFLRNVNGSDSGWTAEKDNFGVKLYKELLWATDARGVEHKYRITLVVNNKGELKIDFRDWYRYP